MAELTDILKAAVEQKASDIFIAVDQPPMIKRAGAFCALQGFAAMDAREVARVLLSSLYEEQRRILQENLELDCTMTLSQLARFRMNISTQVKGLHAVARVIPPTIPTPEELHLPEAVTNLAALARGLVLVTGGMGSGKSTLLACLIEQINKTRDVHIVTIEDLIEYYFAPRSALICQREMGTHAKTYATALKSVLKQSADVVLVGEIRDRDTADAALHLAESGPLVFATLPTTESMQTVERIVTMFPPERHRQTQLRLAATLKAAVSQILLPLADGSGLIAAREVMLMNPAIESAIREGKTPQIYGAIEAAGKLGMVNMDKSILRLAAKKLVSREAALEKCHRPDEMLSALSIVK
ncbi:MAG: PilT/PilU family type 4a pilus ATPase [Elusimicrobia bacterium]|nr:PilT/PilU family type 4a pilus ATPase [Elusimicrobiota bacterium]